MITFENTALFQRLHYSLIITGIFVSAYAFALPSDSEQDLLLEAETLEYNEPSGTITYSGDVLMQQGSMKIHADKVIIHGNIDRATRVVAIGKPAQFEQTPQEGEEPVQARANELEYMVSNKSLLLQGDASLKQEGTSLSGNRIEYDVQHSVVKAGSLQQGSDDKKRVRMVIPPKLLESDSE